jgi:hypothetical protein
MMLGPLTPGAPRPAAEKPIGLAAVAGALGEWDDLEETVQEIYAARRNSRDRAPGLAVENWLVEQPAKPA